MTSSEVFQQFNTKLVTSLPMNDVIFLAELNTKGLFSGGLKAKVKALSTATEAADYFLDNKIEKDLLNGNNDSFLQLLSVMEEYNESLKVLAVEIKGKLNVEYLPVVPRHMESTSVTTIPVKKRKRLISDSDNDSVDFDNVFEKYDKDNNPVGAFAYLLNQLAKLFQEEDFDELQKTCLLRGAVFSSDFKKDIQAANNSDAILDVLDNFKIYCNWLNTRYLKIIVINAGMPKAEKLIMSFEEHFYGKKVSDVKKYFKSIYFDPNHVQIVTLKINANDEHLTVRNLTEYCQELENDMRLPEGSISPADSGKRGCLLLACAMPLHCCLYAYEMMRLNSFKLRKLHIQFLQIGSYPKIFSSSFCDTRFPEFISTVTHPLQIISHYYTYLEGHMDADSVCHMMHCKHLITDDVYDVITSAPNDMKMNCLILQYVKMMDMSQLQIFCSMLKEIASQENLQKNLQIVIESSFHTSPYHQSFALNKGFCMPQSSFMSEIKWTSGFDVFNIHLVFLDLIDSLFLCLSTVEKTMLNLAEECRAFMVSELDCIPLFSEHFLGRLCKCSSYFLLKLMLLPFLTWLDHSILNKLVTASQSEVAMRLLEEFESSIDYTKPITSYPIPALSQLIIPLDDSEYTLVATKCDCNLEEVELRKIVSIRTLLTQKWEITDHAIQLIAVHIKNGFLYWMIPQSVASIINEVNVNIQHELWQKGIIITSVFENSASIEDSTIMQVTKSSPFLFFNVQKTKIDDIQFYKELDYAAVLKHNAVLEYEYKKLSQEITNLRIKNNQLDEEVSDFVVLKRESAKYKSDLESLTTVHQKLKDDYQKLKVTSDDGESSTLASSEGEGHSDDKPDIEKLMNTVSLIQNHWYVIGTRLKLSEGILKEIWKDATRADVCPKETFCCCKMLLHWFKTGKNLTVKNFLEAVQLAPLGLDKKIPLIKSLLVDETTDKSVYSSSLSGLDETEKIYAVMIAEVTGIISKSDTPLDKFKLVLHHSKNVHTNRRKIDKEVYENASSFSTLIDSLQNYGHITHTELSWLKYLVHDVAKSSEALNVIKRYEEINIAHKIHWQSMSKTEGIQGTFLIAKTSKDPSMLKGNDLSQAKSAAVKLVGLDETDTVLDSAGVGSVIIYWKVYNGFTVALPGSITPSLKQMCDKADITHIGMMVNHTITLMDIRQIKIEIGNKDLQVATNILCKKYVNNRYIATDLPFQPTHFSPLTIVCHERQFAVNASSRKSADIRTRTIKAINDLFTPFENFAIFPYSILIEGSSGIGKTTFTKEIAAQWAERNVLNNTKLLLLLPMCDPQVCDIMDIPTLVNYFFEDKPLANRLSEWLVATDGMYLTIILDGCDEVSKELQTDFVDKVIHRRMLTMSCLLLTSVPVALSHLHGIVDCRAEILGFSEEDQKDFMQHVLLGHKAKVTQIGTFVKSNPTITALCYIPLNITMLLCIFKYSELLPITQTELYERSLVIIITSFLKTDNQTSKLDELPYPYSQIVKELSVLAYNSLKKKQRVFTLGEIKAACPKIVLVEWYKLGLLMPVHHLNLESDSNDHPISFVHFVLQEYMAARYIASLSPVMQLQLLKGTFWENCYFNTWLLYICMTNGSSFAFKRFLSGIHAKATRMLYGRPTVSSKILSQKDRRLYVLRCLSEADGKTLLAVKRILQENLIDLSNQYILPNYVQTLAIMLSKSPTQEWNMLNLSNCNIDSRSCDLFCKIFLSQSDALRIKTVDFSGNQFYWESLHNMCDVVRSWHVEELVISIDALYDSPIINVINTFTNKLKQSFQANFYPASNITDGKLLVIYLVGQDKVIAAYVNQHVIKCSQFADCKLNNNLINSLTDFIRRINDAKVTNIDFIINIHNVATIGKLSMLSANIKRIKLSGYNMHAKGAYLLKFPSAIECHTALCHEQVADYIAAVLHRNGSHKPYLQMLPMTYIPATRKFLNQFSDLKKFDLTNNNITTETAHDIAALLSQNSELQEFCIGGNNILTTGAIKIARALQHANNIRKFGMERNSIGFEAANDIAAVLFHNTKLQVLGLSDNNLQTQGAIIIAKALQNTTTLTKFGIRNNSISCDAAESIASVLFRNIQVREVYLGRNNFQAVGVMKIARALQGTTSLTEFDMEYTNIGNAARYVSSVLFCNTEVKVVCLDGNNLQAEGAIKIAKGLRKATKLIKLSMSNNNISKNAAKAVAIVLSCNTNLQELYLGRNNLCSVGAIEIANALQNTATLIKLGLEDNNINANAADYIAGILTRNTKLQVLRLSGNQLQAIGAVKIANGLHNTKFLTVFGIRNNNITNEAVEDIASVLSRNTGLQEVYLSGNYIRATGLITVAKSLQRVTTLRMLGISNIKDSYKAAADIAAILSHNTKLEGLFLKGSNLQTVGAITILTELQKITTLIELDLSNNNIGDKGASYIATVLSHNNRLQILGLRGNKFHLESIKIIAEVLQSLTSLLHLSLSKNYVTEEAADDIAIVVSNNTKLQGLYLGENNIQTVGAIKVSKGLQKITTLKRLNMENNNITDLAADDIAFALHSNSKLTELYLNKNNFTEIGIRKIENALQSNDTVTNLKISMESKR